MKFITAILIACISTISQTGQDFYSCKNARISLFSSAPIEDIRANTATGISVYNPATGDLAFSVAIRSFRFEKSLMQEHFNDDYMESDKYPRATFKGKLQQHPDITKDGSYPVTVTGELEVHGVKQIRTIPGNLQVSNGVITITSEFMVKCADHHISIPSIVFHNIAESLKINVTATYTPAKNNLSK